MSRFDLRIPRLWLALTTLGLLPLAAACTSRGRPPAETLAPMELDGEEYLYEETDGAPETGVELAEFAESNTTPYVLLGTLVTPDEVFDGGLLVEGGRIVALFQEGSEPPEADGVLTIETGGIVLPGLIDLHNHVAYNFLPFWRAGRTFDDRYQWARAAAYKAAVRDPYDAAKSAGLTDEMVKYGEIRALVGGTTSILGALPTAGAGILARNIDQKTLGRDLVRTHVLRVQDFGCRSCPPAEQEAHIEALKQAFEATDATRLAAIFFHVAEGIAPELREEFRFLEDHGLLRPEVVVTHGTALLPEDLKKMGEAGMALVWSPRSNIELYGRTTDVEAAFAAGVRIALAPDWSPSGSDNLLAELRYTARFNAEELDSFFTPRQLVAMATSVPAEIAGWGDDLGRLDVGFVADLLVLERLDPDPFASILTSDERHVRLVTVNGVPLHGFPSFLERLGKAGDFEEISIRGRTRALDTTVREGAIRYGTQTFDDIQASLAEALAPFGDLPSLTANDP